MTSKKIPCYCIFFTIIFSTIFLACNNTMIEKQNSDFSVKIPISQFYNDNTSVSSSDSVYVIEAWVKNKNTTLQTISQNVIPGEISVTIDFKNIPVGQKVKVYIKLTQDQNTIYEGSSDWVIIKMGKNNIKVEFEEQRVPETIDAQVPNITENIEDYIELFSESSTKETIEKELKVAAIVTDGGTLTFMWQKKEGDTWNDIKETSLTEKIDTISDESVLTVTLNKGDINLYKCIVTNTNENVNGKKEITVESKEITVAYIQGSYSGFTANYKGQYETFNNTIRDDNIEITETYKYGEKTLEIGTKFNENYSLVKKNIEENAIGYVPYIVTYNGDLSEQSYEIRIPIKYELTELLKITGTENPTAIWGTEGTPEPVARYTGNATLNVSYGDNNTIPTVIYEDEISERRDYDVITSGVDIFWNGTLKDEKPITVDNITEGIVCYTVILSPKEWCIGSTVSASYYVEVCPWMINIGRDETTDSLIGNTTYELSVSNNATNVVPEIEWESSNEEFKVENGCLVTPAATNEEQTAKIVAKVTIDNKEITIVTRDVVVEAETVIPEYTQTVSDWETLRSLVEEVSSDPLTIELTDDLEAKSVTDESGFTRTYIYVNRPVKIIGNGNKISCGGSIDGFFSNEKGYPLTIEGITMSGNENSSGPLIYSLGNLSLKNCNLINNISSSAGGAIYFGNSEDDVLSLDNVEISGCTSSFGATYVPVAATINLKDVTISGTDVSSSFYVLPTVSTNLSGKIEIGNYYINNEFDRSLELIKVIELDISSKVNVNFVTNDNIKGKNLLEENSSQYRGCFSLPEGYEIKEDGTINLQQSE